MTLTLEMIVESTTFGEIAGKMNISVIHWVLMY